MRDELDKDRANGRRVIVVMAILLVLAMYLVCMARIGAQADNSDVELFVLMYHNIISNEEKAGVYEIRVGELERDLARIAEKGYDVIVPSDIPAIRRGEKKTSRRVVMLTFDDGYYSYVRYLPPLLERYNMQAVVNVVGEYTSLNKDRKDISPRYTYLDYDDIALLASTGRIDIGLHSYGLHHILNGYNGASQRKGECYEDYKARLATDTNRLIDELSKIGVYSDIYAYPYGAYSQGSDEILRGLGITTTLSCSEGVNIITDDFSPYLLKRYNRSGIGGRLEDIFPFFL